MGRKIFIKRKLKNAKTTNFFLRLKKMYKMAIKMSKR
jgi:hypothetical protein